jgi:phosphopantetheinyl transferase
LNSKLKMCEPVAPSVSEDIHSSGSVCALGTLPSLMQGEVWVCQVPKAVSVPHVALSVSEQRRFETMSHLGRRSEFVRGRSILRCILGHLMQCAAADVRIDVDARGRLKLPDIKDMSLSLSHAQGLMLIAVGRVSAVGVDVVMPSPCPNLELSKRILTSNEYRAWSHLKSVEAQAVYVYRTWALKEALIKCVGGRVWDMKKWSLDIHLDGSTKVLECPAVGLNLGARYWSGIDRGVCALAGGLEWVSQIKRYNITSF